MPKLSRSEYPHNAKIYEKKCPTCSVKFFAHRPEAIYCSALCRTNAYLKRLEKSKKGTKPIVKKHAKIEYNELKKTIYIDSPYTNIYKITKIQGLSVPAKNLAVGESTNLKLKGISYEVTRLKYKGAKAFKIVIN